MQQNSKDPVELHLERLASRKAAKQRQEEEQRAFQLVAQALSRCQHQELSKELRPKIQSGVTPDKWVKEMPWWKFSRLLFKDYIAPAMAAVNHWVAEQKVDIDRIPAGRWDDNLKERGERVLAMKGLLWPLLSADVWGRNGRLREPVRKERTAKLRALLLEEPLCLPHYLHFFGVFRVGLAEALRSRAGDPNCADNGDEDLQCVSPPTGSADDAAPGPVEAGRDRARSEASEHRPSLIESDKAPLVSQGYLDSLVSEQVQSEVWISSGAAARETGYSSGHLRNLRSEAYRGTRKDGELVVRVDKLGQVSRTKEGGDAQYLQRSLSKKKGVF